MATFKGDYTQANVLTDDYGQYVKVQHNTNKDSPSVTIWRKTAGVSFLENNTKIRQVSNNEVRVYTAPYGATFAIEVRVND